MAASGGRVGKGDRGEGGSQPCRPPAPRARPPWGRAVLRGEGGRFKHGGIRQRGPLGRAMGRGRMAARRRGTLAATETERPGAFDMGRLLPPRPPGAGRPPGRFFPAAGGEDDLGQYPPGVLLV